MFDIVAQQVWLAPGATDMRKSIDGLAGIVQFINDSRKVISNGTQSKKNPLQSQDVSQAGCLKA